MTGPRLVTFLSDYGTADEFVAVCKGVILQIAPAARILDVTHATPPGAIRHGALMLARSIHNLPIGVNLAVVDPGVGTDRAAIAVRTPDDRCFVGPDNGLLGPAARLCGGAVEAVALDPSLWGVDTPSPTFHGRDVFAPAAGALSAGAELGELGEATDVAGLVPLLVPLAEQDDRGRIHATILWIDHFGNCQTNVTEDDLAAAGISAGDVLRIEYEGGADRLPWARTFGDVEAGRLLSFVDSAGQLAIGLRNGSAAHETGLSESDAVVLTRAARHL